MLAQMEAVIPPKDDPRGLGEAQGIQRIQHPSDLGIDKADRRMVGEHAFPRLELGGAEIGPDRGRSKGRFRDLLSV